MSSKRGRTYDLKLTIEQRAEMVELYRNKEKVDYIAELFGVGREYPGKLARRRGLPKRRNVKCRHADGADGQEPGALIVGARTP